ncbi:MAG: hypothetical protein ABIW79_01585 [Gemmatimonas sp.]
MEKTMHELKSLSAEAIPRALQKAERYRLLNQSWATESICLDILGVDPKNQQVLVMYLLSLTDQFGAEPGELASRAHAVLPQLTDDYQRWYYTGIVEERLGHAKLMTRSMHAEAIAGRMLRTAMVAYEKAEALRNAGNDDAILRWNTCARALDRMRVQGESELPYEPQFGE